MKRPLAALSILAAATLGLAACSGGDAATGSATPSSTSASAHTTAAETSPAAQSADSSIAPCNDPSCAPNGGLFPIDGKYEFTSTYNTTGSFTFDGKANPEIEALRKIAKAKPLHYMNVKVDNRAGTESANMLSVTGYDADGKKYEYLGIDEMIDEWRDVVDIENNDTAGATDLYNRFIDVGNANRDSIDVSEAGTKVLAYEGKLPADGFTRVEVNASGGFDPVDAYLEGQEPQADDYADDMDPSMTIDECMEKYAEVTAEQNDQTVKEVMADPEYRESCEIMVGAAQGGN